MMDPGIGMGGTVGLRTMRMLSAAASALSSFPDIPLDLCFPVFRQRAAGSDTAGSGTDGIVIHPGAVGISAAGNSSVRADADPARNGDCVDVGSQKEKLPSLFSPGPLHHPADPGMIVLPAGVFHSIGG